MKRLLLSDRIFSGLPGSTCFDGYILLEDERILAVGEGQPTADQLAAARVYDYRGHLLTPGLIDAHTHMIFGGDRSFELAAKLAGKSYMELHETGGILATVRATRAASAEELLAKGKARLDQMLLHGTTTVESKSGYGLDLETEVKCLEVNQRLQAEHPLDVVSTFMAAHATPPEFKGRQADYVEHILKDMLPVVVERKLAEYFDIFCEPGIFELEETEKMAKAALAAGLRLKIHADELAQLGGAGLAARLGAVSTEHLMAISDEDIDALAKSQTVACLLPSTSYYLMVKNFAPARKMLEKGVKVAVASDFNPGSSPSLNLQMAMSLAVFGMKMLPGEVFTAVTYRAAEALNREQLVGSLEAGKQADIVVFDCPSLDHFFYDFGRNHVHAVFKKGQLLVDRGQRLVRAE